MSEILHVTQLVDAKRFLDLLDTCASLIANAESRRRRGAKSLWESVIPQRQVKQASAQDTEGSVRMQGLRRPEAGGIHREQGRIEITAVALCARFFPFGCHFSLCR